MRGILRNVPRFKCVVCGTESMIVGKGSEWAPIGGGLFVCQKKVCRDELAKRPMLGNPVPPEVKPLDS